MATNLVRSRPAASRDGTCCRGCGSLPHRRLPKVHWSNSENSGGASASRVERGLRIGPLGQGWR